MEQETLNSITSKVSEIERLLLMTRGRMRDNSDRFPEFKEARTLAKEAYNLLVLNGGRAED